MPQFIPVTNDARQTFTTVLDSQRVRFTIYYLEDKTGNGKNGWFCNLILLSGTPEIIVLGQRLQTLSQVAKNIVTAFTGQIRVVPISAPSQDLTDSAPWESTHALAFFSENEVDELEALANVETV